MKFSHSTLKEINVKGCWTLVQVGPFICLLSVLVSQIIIWDGLQSSKQRKLFGADAKCQMMSSFFVYNL